MSNELLKALYLSAGAANMYCGSCLRDNTLARALRELGCNIKLFPTYTPTRTDEENISEHKVLLGGINLYLQQKFPLFRVLPEASDRWLNSARILRKLAANKLTTSGHDAGQMTVSLLKGEHGYQRKEFNRMISWIEVNLRPDLIHLTNILLAGSVPILKREFNVPVLVTLQGEDQFVEEMREPYRSQAIERIRKLVSEIDGFIVFSQFYADFMSDYFDISLHKIHLAKPGIATEDFQSEHRRSNANRKTIGYLAKVCPEKGLHRLVDAFIALRQRPQTQDVCLKVAGWMSQNQTPFLQSQIDKLRKNNLEKDFEYLGTLSRADKIHFLRSLDVFSVPTTYAEPNGLYALEAFAAGVPIVQPRHGVFPELLQSTGGGISFEPHRTEALAEALYQLLAKPSRRHALGAQGRTKVFRSYTAEIMAQSVLEIYQSHLEDRTSVAVFNSQVAA